MRQFTLLRSGNKGQFTIIGIIMVLLSLVVLGALMPTIVETVTTAQACVTGAASTLLGLVPLFLVVGIIIAIVVYATVHPSQQEYG